MSPRCHKTSSSCSGVAIYVVTWSLFLSPILASRSAVRMKYMTVDLQCVALEPMLPPSKTPWKQVFCGSPTLLGQKLLHFVKRSIFLPNKVHPQEVLTFLS